MNKDSFMSVNDFSRHSGIEKSTLKFWEKSGVFAPKSRDLNNNYRMYLPSQLTAVNFVSILSDLKVPIKEIEKLRNNREPQDIFNLYRFHKWKLARDIAALRDRYSVIELRSDLIEHGLTVDTSKIHLSELDERNMIMGEPNVWDDDSEDFYEPFVRFCEWARKNNYHMGYPIGAYHEIAKSFFENPGRPDRFYFANPFGKDIQPKSQYIIGYAKGGYGELTDVRNRIVDFAEDNALSFAGGVYVLYLIDETCTNDPSQYLAMVSVAVKPLEYNEK